MTTIGSGNRPEAPGRSRNGIPVAMDEICLACLDPWRKYQYATAHDVVVDLDAFISSGRPPANARACPLRWPPFVGVMCRPLLSVTILVALIICLVFGGRAYSRGLARARLHQSFASVLDDVGALLDRASRAVKLMERPLAGYPFASELEEVQAQVTRRDGIDQAVSARERLNASRELADRAGSEPDAESRGLAVRFGQMERRCAALLDRFDVQDEDQAIIKKLEAVRVKKARSLRSVRAGFRFDYLCPAEEYALIFGGDLGLNTSSVPFDLEAQAAKLLDRPARRQYAAYLIDYMFCWGKSLADSYIHTELLRLLFNSREENRHIQALREAGCQDRRHRPVDPAISPDFSAHPPRQDSPACRVPRRRG